MIGAIVRKELRDLAPAAIVISVFALGLTLMVANAFSVPVSQLALICGGLGGGIGLAQGIIDRRRRDDPFLLHRPMSSTRLHAVRGAAASVVAALGATACCILMESAPFAASWKAAAAAAAASGRPGWGQRLQELPTLSQYVTCVVAALLVHAVVRLALTARVRLAAAALVVTLPTTVVFGMMSIETQSAPWLAFAAVWLVAAALTPLQLASTRRPSFERARVALLLVVVVFVSFEGLRYVSTPLWRLQFQVLPRAGVDTSGAVLHWRSRTTHDELGYPWRLQRYDAARRPLAWERAQQPAPPEAATVADLGAPQIIESPLYEAGSGGPPWMPLHRRRAKTAVRFEGAHLLDRGLPPGTNGLGGGPSWVARGGRLLMIAPGEEEIIVGSFGPDDWQEGAPRADRARFAAPPAVVDSWIENTTPQAPHGTGVVVLLDTDARALFVVSGKRVAQAQGGGTWSIVIVEPETLSITPVPLPGDGEIRSLRSPSRYAGCAAVAVGDEIVVLRRGDRSLHRMPWEPDDETPAPVSFIASVADQAEAPTVLVTRRGDPEVLGARLRFRFVGTAGEPIVHNVDLSAVTAGEHAMAWARRAVAIVRPPFLAIASAASARPTEYGEMLGWWARDPLYAGGDAPFTLVLCLMLGVLCALRAASQARLRRRSALLSWTATALLLGPVGLLWLRLVHPRRAVRPCACGRRRAVDVATCPGCDASWPGPAATGAEVLVPPATPAPATNAA